MGGQTSKPYQFKHGDVINGRIDHINIGNSTSVDCSNLRDLTELPLWPNVTTVYCRLCTSLTELPLWPNVTEVCCYNCTLLTELPPWPNVREVYTYLPKLVKSRYTSVDPNKTIYSSQSEKCCICMENPKEIIFNPCYHFDTCIKCAEQLIVSSKCPICRTRIASLIIR